MEAEALSQDEQDFDAAFEQAATEAKPTKPAKKPKPESAEGDDAEQEPKGSSEDEGQGEQVNGDDAQPPEDTVESLRAQLKELEHKERSSANRVGAFMREGNQLKARAQELEREVTRLTAELATAKVVKPVETPASTQALNDVLEDAPELKAAVEGRIRTALDAATRELREKLDAATNQLAEVSQTATQAAQRIEPLANREEQRSTDLVKEQLDKAFPSWKTDIQGGDFGEWLHGQTEQVQAMFHKGRTFAEAGSVLKLFYADKGAPVIPPAGSGAANNDAVRKAAGIAPRANVKPVVNNEDFDGAFAEFAAKKGR